MRLELYRVLRVRLLLAEHFLSQAVPQGVAVAVDRLIARQIAAGQRHLLLHVDDRLAVLLLQGLVQVVLLRLVLLGLSFYEGSLLWPQRGVLRVD